MLMITGASGFIGSQLVEGASAVWGGENVIAFSSSTGNSCRNIVYKNIGEFGLGLLDYELLATVETVMHVGAFTPKSGEEANWVAECNGNIWFTEKLLALPFKRLKKIIFISTIDVYERAELISEATLTLPSSLYGWSKLYCEHMVTVFAARNQISCQILRVGHVYGPGEERYSKFLPKAIKNIIADEAVELWGDGSEVRSYIFIKDVVTAILKAVELPSDVGPINVVGGVPVSMRALLDLLVAASRKPVSIVARKFNGAKRNYIFDSTKLRKYLLPVETDLATGLSAEYAYMAERT